MTALRGPSLVPGPAFDPGVGPFALPPVAAWAVVAAGALLAVAGLWMLWGRQADEDTPRTAPGRWRAGLSEPTRLTLGVCLLAAAWHTLAYSTGHRFFSLSVPPDRWWLAVGVIVAAAGAALALDRIEGRRGNASPEPGPSAGQGDAPGPGAPH